MTADDTAPAVAIWRNGRTQRGQARRDRILSADAAVAALRGGAAMVCVAEEDVDAVRAAIVAGRGISGESKNASTV